MELYITDRLVYGEMVIFLADESGYQDCTMVNTFTRQFLWLL